LAAGLRPLGSSGQNPWIGGWWALAGLVVVAIAAITYLASRNPEIAPGLALKRRSPSCSALLAGLLATTHCVQQRQAVGNQEVELPDLVSILLSYGSEASPRYQAASDSSEQDWEDPNLPRHPTVRTQPSPGSAG
jgi:hypothetical protein